MQKEASREEKDYMRDNAHSNMIDLNADTVYRYMWLLKPPIRVKSVSL